MPVVDVNPVVCSRLVTVTSGKDGIDDRRFMLIKEAL